MHHLEDKRRVLTSLTAAIAIALATAPALAAGFAPTGEQHSFKSAPTVHDSVFEEVRGPSPFDKIGLHHVSAAKAGENPAIVVLYLPGTNMNGTVAPDDVKHSFALYLATRGVDFWAMDYRTHFIAPSTPQGDLKELAGWSANLFASDIEEAVSYVRQQTHRDKIYLAGFSRGVEFEYLYTALHPDRVRGLIVLDGFLPQHPMRTGHPDVYADDIGGQHLTFDKRKRLMEMVIANPDGPAPIPKYKTARENLEHVVYDAADFGGKGGLSNPRGGFSDPLVLAPVLLTYDRYWPAVQNFENPFTPQRLAALKASQVPVIAFASTNIAPQWPSWVEKSAQSTGGKDVSYTSFNGWGHLDVLCGTQAEGLVYARVIEWIRRHQK